MLLKAVFAAAQEVNVPVLVGLSEGEREFVGAGPIAAFVRKLREEFGFPIFLNGVKPSFRGLQCFLKRVRVIGVCVRPIGSAV